MQGYLEMLLNELFKQPVKYVVTDQNHNGREATFTVGDVDYRIGVVKSDELVRDTPVPNHISQLWEFGFMRADADEIETQGGAEILNKGMAPTVFATVIRFVTDTIEQYRIRAIKVEGTVSQPSRLKAYERMTYTMAKQYNWQVVDAGSDGDLHKWYVYDED